MSSPITKRVYNMALDAAQGANGCVWLPGAGFSWIAALILILPAFLAAQHIALREYPLPTTNGYPLGITAGPDGALGSRNCPVARSGASPLTG